MGDPGARGVQRRGDDSARACGSERRAPRTRPHSGRQQHARRRAPGEHRSRASSQRRQHHEDPVRTAKEIKTMSTAIEKVTETIEQTVRECDALTIKEMPMLKQAVVL